MNIDLNLVYSSSLNGMDPAAEKKTVSNIQEYLVEKLRDSSDSMSDKDKEKMNTRIYAKLKSGKKLSSKEEQYLRSTNPQMYLQYKRFRAQAEAMENQLKHAKSKEEANNTITSAISGVSDKDPYKQYVVEALTETAREFKNSDAYAKLPDKKEDGKNKNASGIDNKAYNDEDSDDFDVMSWSPLQEIIDAQPTFNMPA